MNAFTFNVTLHEQNYKNNAVLNDNFFERVLHLHRSEPLLDVIIMKSITYNTGYRFNF